MSKIGSGNVGLVDSLDVSEALRGVGLELLLKAEELIYATRSLNEEGLAELGSDLYLLATVLSCVLQQREHDLRVFKVQLPSNVGALRIKNPYYDQRSGSPEDKTSGRPDDSVGDFPF